MKIGQPITWHWKQPFGMDFNIWIALVLIS
jgi:hypothetical protein